MRKGAKSKFNQDVEATAKRLKIDIFEVILLYAKGDWKELDLFNQNSISPEMQLQAAIQAAKYLYPQKRSVEISNKEDQGFNIIIKDYTVKK